MFGAIGRAHPRLDAIERRFRVGRPGDDGRPGIRNRFFPNFHGEVFFAGARSEGNGRILEVRENTVRQVRVVEGELAPALEFTKGDEFAVGGVAPLFLGANLQQVVVPVKARVPREGEVEMMPSAPGQGVAILVLELEGAAQEEFTEFVADAEFVSERVARAGPVVGDHAYERMAVAALDDFKPTVAREAMLGHRAFNAVRIFPRKLFAVRIVTAHEWEQDGITAADEADLVGCEVRPSWPMQDFPVTGG